MDGKRQDFLRFGVAGMGVGASSVLTPIACSPFSGLGAGADIDPSVRARFSAAYPQARVYASVEDMCADPGLDAIWISTPNRLHADHAVMAARAGKHIIISKPMTTTLKDAERMIEAADRAGVRLIAGHSLGFGPAIRAMASLGAAGSDLGSIKAIQMMAFTDWMLLPRVEEEVAPELGGGLVHRQSPHQIDAARLLGGGRVRSVRAQVGQWMPERRGPGFFSAFLEFESGTVATVSHNGFGYLVGPEIVPWGSDAGISGKPIAARADARRRLSDPSYDEGAAKHEMRLGGAAPLFSQQPAAKPWVPLHLGLTVVSYERGDVRHAPDGLFVYAQDRRSHLIVPDEAMLGLSELEELYGAVRLGAPLYRDGAWGMATLEVGLAIMESARSRSEILMHHQTPVRPGAYGAPPQISDKTKDGAHAFS